MKTTLNLDMSMSWTVAWHLLTGFVFTPYVVWQIWFDTHTWILDIFLTTLVVGFGVDQIGRVVEWRTSYWQDKRDYWQDKRDAL